MIHAPTGESQTRGNIGEFEVGQLVHDLGRRQSRCQQIENVDDANAHAADAGASTTL